MMAMMAMTTMETMATVAMICQNCKEQQHRFKFDSLFFLVKNVYNYYNTCNIPICGINISNIKINCELYL
jgi:hypothetical protein